MDQWLFFMIQSLPFWSFKDIESLPIPIVEHAAQAQNERRDEQNRFAAAIHGVKMDDPKKKNSSAKLKHDMIASPKGSKIISRKELNKALGDG